MKIMLLIAVGTALIGASVSAQTRDQSPKEIEAPHTGSDSCVKKSLNAGRDVKDPDGNSFYEAWPEKWVKGKRPSEGSNTCQNGVNAEGGGSGN